MDKQLREAITEIVDDMNRMARSMPIRSQRDYTTPETSVVSQLLALFHTYGNRERLDKTLRLSYEIRISELESQLETVTKFAELIKELNKEVES